MLSRRHFVTSGLLAAGLSLGNGRGVLALQMDSAEPTSDEPLIGFLALTAALPCSERLGNACLEGLGKREIPSSNLALLVIADLLQMNDHSVLELKKAVQARISKDFEERKIVDVDGWCLSLTETRLYAVSFLQSKGLTYTSESMKQAS
jgi:hypothetical protein